MPTLGFLAPFALAAALPGAGGGFLGQLCLWLLPPSQVCPAVGLSRLHVCSEGEVCGVTSRLPVPK